MFVTSEENFRVYIVSIGLLDKHFTCALKSVVIYIYALKKTFRVQDLLSVDFNQL